jgi:hypothetical protein
MAAIHVPRTSVPLPFPRLNWWLVSGVVLLGIGGTLPVLQNSASTAAGFDIQALDNQQSDLRTEISLLEADVARLTTLERIERRASQLGLGPAIEPPIFVQINEAGPAPAQIPSEYLPGSELQQEPAPRPGWQSFFGKLLFWD